MPEPILEMQSISVSIQNISIIHDIDFVLHPGEIHVVLGENGAGKSSLVKVLCGIYSCYTGRIYMDGKEVRIDSPHTARQLGIVSIQQDTNVFEDLTVAENMFVNNVGLLAPSSIGIISKRKMFQTAQKILDGLSFPIKSSQKMKYLDLAQKRMVEIARISILNPRILILDEPLVSLNRSEAQSFLQLISYFKSKGVAILLVTQKFKEYYIEGDRLTIMRDGAIVSTEKVQFGRAEVADSIEKKVWGKYFPEKYPKLSLKPGPELFCIENLSTENTLDEISFSLNQGEILGVTGLVGSGRSQLAKAIIGMHPIQSGTFYIDRLKASINSPKDAIDYGIAYITEDRHQDGLFLNLNVLENVFSLNQPEDASILNDQKCKTKLYKKYESKINLKLLSYNSPLYSLSGGNQQKVMLLRWLLSSARIFIFDEPTHGIDIASKVDIYNLMNDLVRKHAGILLISSSLEELTGMCDRILVLRDGRIVYEAKRSIPGDFSKIYHFSTCS
jgi:ABC-type sugar transport system ATPase subunit